MVELAIDAPENDGVDLSKLERALSALDAGSGQADLTRARGLFIDAVSGLAAAQMASGVAP